MGTSQLVAKTFATSNAVSHILSVDSFAVSDILSVDSFAVSDAFSTTWMLLQHMDAVNTQPQACGCAGETLKFEFAH